MNLKSKLFTYSFGLSLLASACGGLDGTSPDGNVALPSLAAFAIPTPAQTRSATSQALCSTGTSAIDSIEAFIDDENGALAADRALIKAVLESTPTENAGIYTYEAEVSARTLNIEVTTDGENAYVYTGVLTDDEGEHDYLSGTMANDGAQGSLDITPPDADALHVVWSETANTLAYVRTRGEKSTTFSQNEVAIDVVSGGITLHWSLEDYSGMLIGDGMPMCFDGGESSSDFCDVDCSGVDLDGLGI